MKANGAEKKEAAPAAAPAALTELERLKLENFGLRYQALQQQMQQILADRAVLLRQIEADHTGYRWDDQRGLVLAELLPGDINGPIRRTGL